MKSFFSLSSLLRLIGTLLAGGMLLLLFLPVLGLLLSCTPSSLLAGIRHPLFAPALWLSLKTTLLSLLLVLVMGTPLAWWLATSSSKATRWLQPLVLLPVLLPPAVIGVALLQTFGRSGLLGTWLTTLGLQIPFTSKAVVLAQIVVSAPFFIQSATTAFRRLDPDLLLVARTLGQSSTGAFFRIAIPVSMPGLLAGAALCWGRSLAEFGATLLFAGNLTSQTQTMPLAIYMALESDVRAALALSLFLAGFGVCVLVGLRLLSWFQQSRTATPVDALTSETSR